MNSKVPQGKLNSLDNKKPPTLPTESKKELEKTEEENEEGEEEEEEDPIKERPKEEEKEKLEISDIQDNDKERRKSLPNEVKLRQFPHVTPHNVTPDKSNIDISIDVRLIHQLNRLRISFNFDVGLNKLSL